METKTIHKSNISFVEVLAALVEFFTLCALFIIQGTAKTARTAGEPPESLGAGSIAATYSGMTRKRSRSPGGSIWELERLLSLSSFSSPLVYKITYTPTF